MNDRATRTVESYDASGLIGLRTIIRHAVTETTDEDGEVSIEIPDLATASAAAAMTRCLMPVRILGSELRAIRRIAGMTAAEVASAMGDKTAPETISRWENGKQDMGGFAEKVFRLVMCERLRRLAPGVHYKEGAIATLVVLDPRRADPAYEVPAMVLERVRMRLDSFDTISAWTPETARQAA